MQKLELILKKYFGFDHFRHPQKTIITRLIEGSDVLAILPTGNGKSLCYQLPAVILPPTTLVISPLIALMKDQVDKLNNLGIKAGLINSNQSLAEQRNQIKLFKSGYFQLIYVSPERLQSKNFINACQMAHISLIAVDEAHCISQWGHQFRPEYLQISQFLKKIKNKPPIIALTATASKKTQQTIMFSLGIKKAKLFRASVYRSNIDLSVLICPSESTKLLALCQVLNQYQNKTCLVYCATRKATRQLYDFFSQFSHYAKQKINYYHGGMEKSQRESIQTQFAKQNSAIMFATNAFGMGIDRANIRLIVHYHFPGNLESYAQEIGRAGRDGRESRAVAFFSKKDLQIQIEMIKHTLDPKQQQREFAQLKTTMDFIYTNNCRNLNLQKYFAETNQKPCGHCDNCQIKSTKKNQSLIDRSFLNFYQRITQHKILKNKFPLNISSYLWWQQLQPANLTELIKVPGIGRGWTNQFSQSEINELIKLAI